MQGKSKRGGPRPGAGRKPGERVVYRTRLHPDRIEWIKEQADKQKRPDCEIVEDAIDRRRKQKP